MGVPLLFKTKRNIHFLVKRAIVWSYSVSVSRKCSIFCLQFMAHEKLIGKFWMTNVCDLKSLTKKKSP
jgi:hypothetical protein